MIRPLLAGLLALSASAAASPAPAASTDTPAAAPTLAQLQQRAVALRLWEQQGWQRLLHYKARLRPGGRVLHSQVRDPRFFLADDGAHNPRAELLATLEGLHRAGPYGEEHPLCRFVARRHWLAAQLGWTNAPQPLAHCALYREWRDMVPDARATLVFPAYHLNSPSSMFGHTLLRLDPPATPGWSDYLSFSVSFGADVRADDNAMFYALKGLTGGYPGRFIVTPYFEKIREYNRIENRDVWEYPLNLDAQETQRLVRHLWELRDIPFPYYFFDENCSYRVLELLEVARPQTELTAPFKLTAIPIDTVRAVQRGGFVEGSDFRASRSARLQARLQALPPERQPLVRALAADPERLASAEYRQLSPAEQAQVVDAAYEYLGYRNAKAAHDPALAARSHALLRALAALPRHSPPEPPRPLSPDRAHDSKRAALAYGVREGRDFAQLGLRMSFHDLEDRSAGFLEGAQINIGSLDLRVDREDARLQALDLVDIVSLTPRDAWFQPWSWGVRAGLERALDDPQQRLAAHVTGGGGGSWRLAPGWLAYGLAWARLERGEGRDPAAALGPRAGLLWTRARMSSHLALQAQAYSDGRERLSAQWTTSYHLGRNQALQIRLAEAGAPGALQTEAVLALRLFFD